MAPPPPSDKPDPLAGKKASVSRQWRRNPDRWRKPSNWASRSLWTRDATISEKVKEEVEVRVEQVKETVEKYKQVKTRTGFDEALVLGVVLLVSWPWLAELTLVQLLQANSMGSAFIVQIRQLQLVASRLLMAALCGAIIGVERKEANRPAGLRSMTLTSTGSALYVCACIFAPDADMNHAMRTAAQICCGVGFIGAGVIAKGKPNDPTRGVTTACAVWLSAAIGVVAASGMSFFALYATGVAVSILRISRWYNTRVLRRMQHALTDLTDRLRAIDPHYDKPSFQ